MYGNLIFLHRILKILLTVILVVHHMSEGENVRVRCISEDKPHDDAIIVTPNLEDAYLWLLRKQIQTDS